MSNIKQLEVRRLIKELDFLESDLNYRNEVVNSADTNFIESVNKLLEEHLPLKEIFDNKINKKLDSFINDNVEYNIDLEDYEDYESEVEKPPKLKKFYREIVKSTHPDKVKNKKLNNIYIKATNYYNNNDIIGIYGICDELEMDYDPDELEIESVIDKIDTIKKQISFMESKITWVWFHSKDDKEKENIILNYIKSQIL